MDWDAAMEQIAARLDTMTGMRRFEEGESPEIPCCIVSYPEEVDPHGTYNRGVSTMKLQVMMLTGLAHERQARQVAKLYVNDTATGVVSVLENGVAAGAYTAFDEITVLKYGFDAVQIQDIDYMAVLLDLDVAGRGV